VTGSALPGQVSQGAVAGSLKLSVTHFGRAVWFEGVSMNLSCQSLRGKKEDKEMKILCEIKRTAVGGPCVEPPPGLTWHSEALQ
jgi:hypothetical protein